MRIGIDIDGTITTPFYWLDFYNKKLNKSIKPKEITSYDHAKPFGITELDFRQFRERYLYEIHTLAEPRDQAAYFVNKLFFEHQQISIITAREKKLEILTHKWLLEHNISFSSLHHLGSTNKVSTAIIQNLDLFIEDRLETAQEMIIWGIPTLLFNTPYNQGYDHPLLFRVNTWKEVYEIILGMDKENEKNYLKTSSIHYL